MNNRNSSVAFTELAAFLVFGMAGCGAPAALDYAGPADASTADAGVADAGVADAGAADAVRKLDPGCSAPAGVSNSPRTIADTVTLLNALPKPVTLPCFLEALARPLEISASTSMFSVQPAQGSRSPRIFLFLDPDIISIVPDGPGAELLELGEEQPGYRSLKAQLSFPVPADLTQSSPFEGFMYTDQMTTCALCHSGEAQDPSISDIAAFDSSSLQPYGYTLVSADELRQQLQSCDPSAEPYRCAMLDGLFGWGAVTDRAFPADMPTF